jgi:hypothetical protein
MAEVLAPKISESHSRRSVITLGVLVTNSSILSIADIKSPSKEDTLGFENLQEIPI